MVRERDLAGSRHRAAADERDAPMPCGAARGTRASSTRGSRRRRPATMRTAASSSASASLERRQDAGQAAREHRLAGAGRSDEQQVMRAGRGDLERASRVRLAAHVGEVGCVRIGNIVRCRRLRCGKLAASAQDMRAERRAANRRRARRHRGRAPLRRRCRAARRRGVQPRVAHQHGRQHAVHGAQLARKRELADELVIGERIARNAAVRGEDAERDRKVEAAAVLGQVRRREIHGDLAAAGSRAARSGSPRARGRALPLRRFRADPTIDVPGRPPDKCTSTSDQRRGHAVLRAAEDDGETHASCYEKSPAAPPGVSSASSRRPGKPVATSRSPTARPCGRPHYNLCTAVTA